MTSLAQEMERKGHGARMQVSNGGFLTPSKPPNLLLQAGGQGIAEVRFLDEKRDEVRRQKRSLEEKDGPRDRAGLGGGGREGT